MPYYRVEAIADDGSRGDEPVLLADSPDGAAQGYRDLGGDLRIVKVTRVSEPAVLDG